MPEPFHPDIATRAMAQLDTWRAEAGLRFEIAPCDFAVL
ncbi:MAG: hypothetical protein ACJAU5_001761, partial [Maricaulis maris]